MTFLQLLKILLSLSGIFIASYLVNPFLSAFDSASESDSNACVGLMNILCLTAMAGLLILCYILLSYSFKCRLSMLKQIGIGAALTILCAL